MSNKSSFENGYLRGCRETNKLEEPLLMQTAKGNDNDMSVTLLSLALHFYSSSNHLFAKYTCMVYIAMKY